MKELTDDIFIEKAIKKDNKNIFRIGLKKKEIIYWVFKLKLFRFPSIFKELQKRKITEFDSYVKGAYIENFPFLKNKTEEICLEVLQERPDFFKFIENQSKEICLAAIREDFRNIRYVKEQTPELCLEAVKERGWALRYIKRQTPEICLEAVKQDGEALQYVKAQTPEICLEAVKNNEWAIDFVKEQTPEICLEAVKINPYTIKRVKNLTKEMVLIALSDTPDIIEERNVKKYLTEDIIIEAIKKGSYNSIFTYISPKFLSERVIEEIIKKDCTLSSNIPTQKLSENNVIFAFNLLKKNNNTDASFSLFSTLPERLITKDTINAAIEAYPNICSLLKKKYFTKELCEKIFSLSKNKEIIKYFPKKFITNEMAIIAVSENNLNYLFLKESQKRSKEIQLLLNLNG